MDLITTPAYHTSNSYGTLAQATTYYSTYGRLNYSSTWDNLTTDEQEYALVIAAKLLNTFNFRGIPVTRAQKLAFPRFTNYQMVHEDKTSLATFYDIEYEKIIDAEELTVTGNKFISTNSSADMFYNYLDNETLLINQLIKVVRGGTEYFTVLDIDADGEWIEVKEAVESESDPTTTIYVSDIFGFPNEIMYAQFELANQVVDTKIFQATIGEATEKPIASFYIAGAMHVTYENELFKANKFENSVALDIVHYLLGDWLAGVKGRMV
jgi:hypothetical protein